MFKLILIVCMGTAPDQMACVAGEWPTLFQAEQDCATKALAFGNEIRASGRANGLAYGKVGYVCETTDEVMG